MPAARDADLGGHVSVAGGLETCFERAREPAIGALQIFVKNQRQWAARPLAGTEVAAFRSAWRRSGVGHVVAHGTYLVNLASDTPEFWARSVTCMGEELRRAAALRLLGVVVHPGSTRGPREAGIERICLGLEKALGDPATKDAAVLLETTAGQGGGGCIGARFEDLRAIVDGLPRALGKRVFVCFDTCHLHAAGYDVTTAPAYDETMRELDSVIGADRVRAIHLNDSQRERGSRVDRHANIGEGTIGLACFEALLADARFAGVPKILETPLEDRGRERDLAILRAMRGRADKRPRAARRGRTAT